MGSFDKVVVGGIEAHIAVAVWLVEESITRCAPSKLQFGALREDGIEREKEGALSSRKAW